MSKKLKVGVIGVGGIAQTHFPGWRASPHAEIAALADLAEEPLERAGKELGVTRLFAKPEELLALEDLDIVDICTPNMYHAPLSIGALEAGKHVICEKPLAPNPAEIRRMIAARDKAGKLLMTAQHFRFLGNAVALKNEIDTGVLGPLYHARAWMLRRAGAPLKPGFFMKRHSGGGPCIDIGVHILDLTLWLMGFPKPVSVSGVTQNKLSKRPGAFGAGGPIPKEFDVEEFAAAFVRFETGATLILETSWLLHHQQGPSEDKQVWLYGEDGGAHWPRCELYRSNMKTRRQIDEKLLHGAQKGDPHALECAAFAEAIANGKPSPVPPEQSLEVMKILDGLYRSAKEGKEIDLRE